MSDKDLFPKQVSGKLEGNIEKAETTHAPTMEGTETETHYQEEEGTAEEQKLKIIEIDDSDGK